MQPGYDVVVEAMGGLMSITGEPDGEPMKVGVAIIDIVTGCLTSYAVTAALRERSITGHGQCVDLSLLDPASPRSRTKRDTTSSRARSRRGTEMGTRRSFLIRFSKRRMA